MFTVNASRGSGSPSLSHLRPTLRFTVTAFEGLGSPFQRGVQWGVRELGDRALRKGAGRTPQLLSKRNIVLIEFQNFI